MTNGFTALVPTIRDLKAQLDAASDAGLMQANAWRNSPAGRTIT